MCSGTKENKIASLSMQKAPDIGAFCILLQLFRSRPLPTARVACQIRSETPMIKRFPRQVSIAFHTQFTRVAHRKVQPQYLHSMPPFSA
jgi:hypothetical protein